MTNPIIVDTVENSFVPLLIYNNQRSDSDLLKKFGEPSWNYQVIRFFDADGKDIIPRKDRVWTTKALVPRMIQALKKSNQPVPEKLSLLAKELNISSHSTAAFAQHCYWTGEFRLGGLDGVITTEAGWYDGREVTLVQYDKNRISLNQLIKSAKRADVASVVYLPSEQVTQAEQLTSVPVKAFSKSRYRIAKTSDQKKQISGTRYSKLKLTKSQATKVNAFARTDRKKANSYLTKQQLEQL